MASKSKKFKIGYFKRIEVKDLAKRLKEGQRLVITNVGIFYVRNIKARKGTNPRTGEAIDIPAHKRVKFYCSKVLKRFIND